MPSNRPQHESLHGCYRNGAMHHVQTWLTRRTSISGARHGPDMVLTAPLVSRGALHVASDLGLYRGTSVSDLKDAMPCPDSPLPMRKLLFTLNCPDIR
ncbi:hypothetical protein GOBAR_AA10285 [Gossypium barbadense]|uniref:Uncharacterized protein n=1 Tax=Gossypium barbadense TaxID=3634 RepID=A0A2P5Y457_GOSBA|nr:hypothetical protein GOBAR_AA10285 [Gossypium barbadense]